MIDKLLKVDSTKDNLVDQIQDLQERIAELERFALTSQDIVATKIECSGDIYTVEWEDGDYSSLSTVVGWTSYTEKIIWYKKIGKLVFVLFRIAGTSDVNSCSFTVPYTRTSLTTFPRTINYITDNGTHDIGYFGLSETTVSFRPDLNSTTTGWTTSGTKAVYGQFWYEVA